MRRLDAGTYQITGFGDEQVRAFIPAPLPPSPPISFDGRLQQLLEAAVLALGRLDGIATLLPDPTLLIYTYIRKEAVLSSQIEGTQSSLSDLLMFELDEARGVPLDDVVEVSNYVAALVHGLDRMRGGFPLSNRLIREIHGVLLSRGRGNDKTPGEFRTSQNWIGGSRPGNAVYVPPPHTEVADCMGALERFLHDRDDGLTMLARAGVAHAQFETIHPFLDGNGRVGRLLITFLLCESGVLREPLLYLSLYLKQHRSTYYELLNDLRSSGDWENWLDFFFDGVRETAEGAFRTAHELLDMFEVDKGRIGQVGRRAGSALRVHQVMMKNPVLTLDEVCKVESLAFSTASSSMELLVRMGIAREVTGRARNRVFAYDRYLAVLNEGTELE